MEEQDGILYCGVPLSYAAYASEGRLASTLLAVPTFQALLLPDKNLARLGVNACCAAHRQLLSRAAAVVLQPSNAPGAAFLLSQHCWLQCVSASRLGS
jgi:hypothetical protein